VSQRNEIAAGILGSNRDIARKAENRLIQSLQLDLSKRKEAGI